MDHEIERRLRRLERANWMIAVGLLAVAGLFVLSGARNPPRVVRAEKIVVEDAKGIDRIVMEASRDDTAIWFPDGPDHVAIMLGVNNKGAMLNLDGKAGDEHGSANLISAPDGASLEFYKPNLTRRVTLGYKGNNVFLDLKDKDGKNIWSKP